MIPNKKTFWVSKEEQGIFRDIDLVKSSFFGVDFYNSDVLFRELAPNPKSCSDSPVPLFLALIEIKLSVFALYISAK